MKLFKINNRLNDGDDHRSFRQPLRYLKKKTKTNIQIHPLPSTPEPIHFRALPPGFHHVLLRTRALRTISFKAQVKVQLKLNVG